MAVQGASTAYSPGYNRISGTRHLYRMFRENARGRSLRGFAGAILAQAACLAAYRPIHSHRTFQVGGRSVPYLSQPTATERAVEVPWVLSELDSLPAGQDHVLEIGNVLTTHAHVARVVVDKYEQAPGVLNIDVAEITGMGRFDAIISVSTLEHVGYDEPIRDPGKMLASIRRLHDESLGQGGTMIATFPLGYNPAVDALVRAHAAELGEIRILHRISFANIWEERSIDELPQSEGLGEKTWPRVRWLALSRFRQPPDQS